MLAVALIFLFISFFLIGYFSVPAFFDWTIDYNRQRQRQLEKNIEQLMSRQEAKKISTVFILGVVSIPLVTFILTFVNFGIKVAVVLTVLAIILSIFLPGMYVNFLRERNKKKFNDQLVDALMIMSSCLRAGLSLIQAIEAVIDEMSDPSSKEFGIVIGENKMGVTLEDSLNYLYNRMGSSALQQMNTAILLARETGGNLPLVFERISNTVRENKKVKQQLDALTVQGKIQGVVMSMIPVVFTIILFKSNRDMFDLMINTKEGQMILMIALVLWVIGVFLIFKFSKIDY